MPSDKKKPTHKIQLEIYEETFCDFYAYHLFIADLIEKKKNVPAIVLKKYLEYFEAPMIKEQEIADAFVQNLIQQAHLRFKGTEYDFCINKREKGLDLHHLREKKKPYKPTYYTAEYSLIKMLESVCKDVVSSIKESRILRDKDERLKYLYQRISRYRNDFPKRKQKKVLSDYKIQVISAYITQLMGFGLTNKKNPTNNDLFQASRNAISKLKKGKP